MIRDDFNAMGTEWTRLAAGGSIAALLGTAAVLLGALVQRVLSGLQSSTSKAGSAP